jgi:hypothetical protein
LTGTGSAFLAGSSLADALVRAAARLLQNQSELLADSPVAGLLF